MQGSGPPSGGGFDWPDDETYAGPSPVDATRARPTMSARGLLEESALDVKLSLLAGATGVERPIAHTRIQKSGLALAGHYHGIVPTRIQILGQTEQSFVDRLDRDARGAALAGFFGLGLSCVILTGPLGSASRELIAAADATGTPILHAADRSSVTITSLHALLDERLAPRRRMHGVLIDVFGVGLFITGPSGVGKSECALDLVMRGHRLVADDVVECDYRPPGMIFGAPAKLLRHHLEVRGLGILNIKDLFGVTAIRERKRIDVVLRLVLESQRDAELDRLGIDERFSHILGVAIPELVIPVRPGRDMASILEVAARNELLKNAGHHAARELFGTIESSIQLGSEGAAPPPSVRVRPPESLARGIGRPPMMSENEVARGRGRGFARNDESAAPPPVTSGPQGSGRGRGR
ncbi:MAG TPA: HPr(Ser) kinase/phosphatase [Polyangiaceae bacterium]|nr:HPr(Ser) kinase/phosphatase [Polyangiaceae bacterium]